MTTCDSVNDLIKFLSADSPSLDVRIHAADYFTGLTGTEVGRNFLTSIPTAQLSDILIGLLSENNSHLQMSALNSLVNLSADEKNTDLLTKTSILRRLFYVILKPKQNDHIIEASTMALSNIAHWENGAAKIMHCMDNYDDSVFDKLIESFFNTTVNMNYVGSFLGNITQVKEARIFILNKNKPIFKKLLAYLSFQDSITRRKGVVSAIKNCCFEIESHMWMLGEKINILPSLLLPLAGPEEFDDDEVDKLPMDLQYLGLDKKREADPEIRKMLLEAVNKLCATKEGRNIIKDQNAYLILRELHKWEKNENCIVALENLVSVLISDEPQQGMENLNEVEIPENIERKFINTH